MHGFQSGHAKLLCPFNDVCTLLHWRVFLGVRLWIGCIFVWLALFYLGHVSLPLWCVCVCVCVALACQAMGHARRRKVRKF